MKKLFKLSLPFSLIVFLLSTLFIGCDPGAKEKGDSDTTDSIAEDTSIVKIDTARVRIEVKTDSITKGNVDKMIAIYSDYDTTKWGEDHKNHLSKIKVANRITWSGSAYNKSLNATVRIIKVSSKKDGRFKILRGKAPFTGTDSVTAMAVSAMDTATDHYIIHFMVSGKKDTFEIDPILRMVSSED